MIYTMQDKQVIYQDFKAQINMTASGLKQRLGTTESKSVGITKGTTDDRKTSSTGRESTGHESGTMITKILDKTKGDLTDDDYSQMKRVNAFIKRHTAQKPSKESIRDSRWRYSLMNWGHDPVA